MYFLSVAVMLAACSSSSTTNDGAQIGGGSGGAASANSDGGTADAAVTSMGGSSASGGVTTASSSGLTGSSVGTTSPGGATGGSKVTGGTTHSGGAGLGGAGGSVGTGGNPASSGTTSTGGTRTGGATTGGTSASADLAFAIDVSKGPARQYQPPAQPVAISPYVYGINGFGTLIAAKTKWGLIRQGGDACTAYNWTNDYTNNGDDYCFWEGVAGNGNLAGKYTETTGDTIPAAQAKGEAFLATIPILDFVSATYDHNTGWSPSGQSACPGTDSACPKRSGTVGANVIDPNPGDPGYNQALDFASSDPASPAFVKNVMVKGSAFCSCAPGTATCAGCTVGANPVAEDEFVNFLKVNYGAGAPVFFDLDNEPNYWEGTHPELWPNICGTGTVTYDDIVTRNQAAALAVKNVWPAAKVFGPVVAQDGIVYAHSYGLDPHWPTEFADYYLQRMQAASTTAGMPLLDAYDVHYYTTGGTSDAQCAQAPRLFWDPNFTDITAPATDSLDFGWNGDVGSGAYFDTNWYPRQMIPRLQKKIASAYPAGGTAAPGLAFSEYNPGCETSIGGGLAQADLLGVFGREGVFAATAWPMHSTTANFLVAAFDLFRNYDGNGAVVGDLAVLANSSDYKNISVYAFAHSDATAGIEVVAVNKNASAQSVTIQLAGGPALTSATLYQLAGKTAAVARVGGTAPAVSCAGGVCTLVYTMPAMSATTIVLR
jgi:Glycoside hydrolase family 44